jgi:hypothetical protein
MGTKTCYNLSFNFLICSLPHHCSCSSAESSHSTECPAENRTRDLCLTIASATLLILLVSVSGPGQLVFRDGVHPGWRPHVSAHQVWHLPGVPRQVSPRNFQITEDPIPDPDSSPKTIISSSKNFIVLKESLIKEKFDPFK